MYENVGESQYMDSDELCRRIQEMEKYVAACLQELDMRVSQQLTLLLPPPPRISGYADVCGAEPEPLSDDPDDDEEEETWTSDEDEDTDGGANEQDNVNPEMPSPTSQV